ncbi:hypothetical protein D9M72_329420 [compost metagenome]
MSTAVVRAVRTRPAGQAKCVSCMPQACAWRFIAATKLSKSPLCHDASVSAALLDDTTSAASSKRCTGSGGAPAAYSAADGSSRAGTGSTGTCTASAWRSSRSSRNFCSTSAAVTSFDSEAGTKLCSEG